MKYLTVKFLLFYICEKMGSISHNQIIRPPHALDTGITFITVLELWIRSVFDGCLNFVIKITFK